MPKVRKGRQTPTKSIVLPYAETRGQEAIDLYNDSGRTAQEWQEALILMKTHQMIELPSAIGNLEDDSPIYIYSTINIFCSAADINELVEMFKGETGETEEQKEAEYSEKTQDQWETQDEMRSE